MAINFPDNPTPGQSFSSGNRVWAWDATLGAWVGGLKPIVHLESITVACSDEDTALTTGVTKVTFNVPYAFVVIAIRANVKTAPVGANLVIDVNEGGSTIMSSNKVTIEAGSLTSLTAAVQPGITDPLLANDAIITIDIDQVGSSAAGAGLKVTLIGYQV